MSKTRIINGRYFVVTEVEALKRLAETDRWVTRQSVLDAMGTTQPERAFSAMLRHGFLLIEGDFCRISAAGIQLIEEALRLDTLFGLAQADICSVCQQAERLPRKQFCQTCARAYWRQQKANVTISKEAASEKYQRYIARLRAKAAKGELCCKGCGAVLTSRGVGDQCCGTCRKRRKLKRTLRKAGVQA